MIGSIVQLELAGLGRHGHRDVVADDLVADLVHDLGDHRVHLARHDRRARLHRRQLDLVEAAARSGREQAQIVADLRDLHGGALQHAPTSGRTRRRPASPRPGRRRRRRAAPLTSAQPLHHRLGVPGRAVDAGADRRRAQVDVQQEPRRLAQARLRVADHRRVGAELLAERHRHGVLLFGASHLEDVGELLRLGLERSLAGGRIAPSDCRAASADADLDRRRIGVVRRLRAVDVVVRVAGARTRPSGGPAARAHDWRSPRWRSCWSRCRRRPGSCRRRTGRAACRR